MPALKRFISSDELPNQRQRHFAAVRENAARMMHPLPDLRAGNFGGGRVFHQIVKRHATEPAQPRLYILNPHANVARRPSSVIVPSGGSSSWLARTLVLPASRSIWFDFVPRTRSNSSIAIGNPPGCATTCRRGRRSLRGVCPRALFAALSRWPRDRSSQECKRTCRPSRRHRAYGTPGCTRSASPHERRGHGHLCAVRNEKLLLPRESFGCN